MKPIKANFFIKLSEAGINANEELWNNIFGNNVAVQTQALPLLANNETIAKIKKIISAISEENFFYFLNQSGIKILEYINKLSDDNFLQRLTVAMNSADPRSLNRFNPIFEYVVNYNNNTDKVQFLELIMFDPAYLHEIKKMEMAKSQAAVTNTAQPPVLPTIDPLDLDFLLQDPLAATAPPYAAATASTPYFAPIAPATQDLSSFLTPYWMQLSDKFTGSPLTRRVIQRFQTQIEKLAQIFPDPNLVCMIATDKDEQDSSSATAIWALCENIEIIEELLGKSGFKSNLHFKPDHLLEILLNAGKNLDFVLKKLNKVEARLAIVKQCSLGSPVNPLAGLQRIRNLIDDDRVGHRLFFDSFELKEVWQGNILTEIVDDIGLELRVGMTSFIVKQRLENEGQYNEAGGILEDDVTLVLSCCRPADIDRLSILFQNSVSPHHLMGNLRTEMSHSGKILPQVIQEKYDSLLANCITIAEENSYGINSNAFSKIAHAISDRSRVQSSNSRLSGMRSSRSRGSSAAAAYTDSRSGSASLHESGLPAPNDSAQQPQAMQVSPHLARFPTQ